MTDTPTDREAVERLEAYATERERLSVTSSSLGDHIHGFGTRNGEMALLLSDIRALLAAKEAAEAERDMLREALMRIEEASNHYAMISTFSEGTLRYAHESTKRLARAALATLDQPEEGKDDE